MPRRTYSDHEIDQALIALYISGRNSQVASQRLREQGLVVNARTLRSWKDKHAERYLALAGEHGPRLEKELRAVSKQVALNAAEGAMEAVEAAREQIRNGEAKDPSTTARNLAVTQGIATDKTLLLEGRPTEIHGTDLPRLMERMRKALGQPVTVDSTAEEDVPSDARVLESGQQDG